MFNKRQYESENVIHLVSFNGHAYKNKILATFLQLSKS